MKEENKKFKCESFDNLTGKKKAFKDDMDIISSIMKKWGMQGMLFMMGDVGAIIDFKCNGDFDSNLKLKLLLDGMAKMARDSKDDEQLKDVIEKIRPFTEKLALAIFDPDTPSSFMEKLLDDVKKRLDGMDPSESWKHSFEKCEEEKTKSLKLWPKGITDLADEYNHKFLKGKVDGMDPSHMDFFITVANKVKTHDEIDYMDFIKLFEQIKPKLEM